MKYLMLFSYVILLKNTTGTNDGDCQFDPHDNKPPGREYKEIVNSKADTKLKPFDVQSLTSRKKCNNMCKSESKCQMAEFDNNLRQCRLFNETGQTTDSCCSLYQWNFCYFKNPHFSKYRCQGNWIFRADSEYYDFPTHRFSATKAVNGLDSCKEWCLNTPVCGIFNFNTITKACTIIEQYENKELDHRRSENSVAYIYKCAAKQIYHLNHNCRTSTKNCLGTFHHVTNVSVELPLPPYILKKFYTRNYKACLTACMLYVRCTCVLFSESHSQCILLTTEKKVCTEPNTHINYTEFTVFVWKCCMTYSALSLKLNSVYQPNTHAVCTCVADNNGLYIKKFVCDATTSMTNFTDGDKCIIMKYKKRNRLRCLVGQCFLVLNQWEDTIRTYTVVYTGYETFVIMSTKTSQMQYFPTDYFCRYFNATIIKKEPNIISRNQWYAIDKNEPCDQLVWPVKYVVIGSQMNQYCFCVNDVTCQAELRESQSKYLKSKKKDFPYNFIVTPSGSIYEGLGWNNKTYIKPIHIENHSHIIYIAFLGNYSNGRPLVDSSTAAKKLIYMGVQKGYIRKKYILLPAFSIGQGTIKDANSLYTVISLWKNYKGRWKPKCIIYDPIIVIMNTAIAFSVLFMGLVIGRRLIFSYHSTCCAVVMNTLNSHKIDWNVFYYCNEETVSFLDMQTDQYSLFSISFLNDNIKIFTQYTDFYWLASRSEIIQYTRHSSLCYQFIKQVIQYQHHAKTPIDFSTIDKYTILRNCKWKTLALLVHSKSIFERNVVVIVHVDSKVTNIKIQSIIRKFYNKRCFCKNFMLEKIKYSDKTNVVRKVNQPWKHLDDVEFDIMMREKVQTFDGIPYQL